MLNKTWAALFLAASLQMGGAHCAEGTTIRGAAPAATQSDVASASAAGYLGALDDADLLPTTLSPAPQLNSAVPEPNPYALLLVGLVMLGFTSRRARNEIFSRNP
ncbi:PEP-CTERM sorting domain-containing protein [Janthinobacterium fluminis]|uniref:PEP-CTERM sorting domain-containing protein n=1 Tax=Janthinobacterium fluminis TaxID=2987524 RepID=A0ABT5JXG0_9BURK|nr:PEP-CTERM sorting domain-containing protein [Janthinobacterium fluminis]MDC8757434.1 PEP-CTERM sorting domain-containing protein [Janthinobacterium fluminis]